MCEEFSSYDFEDPERFERVDSASRPLDVLDTLVEYEDGQLSEDEVVAFFQVLINTGYAWRLQGNYGRTAQALIDAGLCTP